RENAIDADRSGSALATTTLIDRSSPACSILSGCGQDIGKFGGVFAQLSDGRRLPVIGAQHRPQVEQMRPRPAVGVDDRPVTARAQSETERIRHAQSGLQQIAPERMFRAHDAVVRTRTVDHLVENFRMKLARAPCAPHGLDALGARDEALDESGVNMQASLSTQELDALNRLRRQTMTVHVPSSTQMTQEAQDRK